MRARLNELVEHDQSPWSRDAVIFYEDHPNPPDWSKPESGASDEPNNLDATAPMADSVPDSVPEPEPPVGQTTESTSTNAPDREEQPEPTESKTFAFNISVKGAIRVHTTRAEEAIVKEIDRLFKDKEVLVSNMTVNSCGRRHTKIYLKACFAKKTLRKDK